jgi:MarR family transcriptional regulator, 2-MHQ and catechol-resistance regulon repressor
MPTHYSGTPDETRALDALIKLVRATETIGARLAKALQPTHLTPGQLSVLEALHHLGPMHACALSKKLLRSNANMTTVLDNLEKAGLVARERTREDRRYVRITLTPAGRRRIENVFPAHVAEVSAALSALTAAEQEELGRLCKKLGLAQREPESEEEST